MKFKFIRFTAACLLSVTAFTAYSAKNVTAFKSDIKVDGINKEWASPLPRYDKNTGLQFDIANDERNLHLIVRVTDTTTQRQILNNGMEFWINMDGKKKMTTGITYPIAPEKVKAGTFEAWRQKQYAKANLPQNPELFILTGFLLENGKQPVKNNPVKVAIDADSSDYLVYEATIPFNTFYKEQLDPEDKGAKWYFGFVIKGTPEDQMQSRMGAVMSRMGGPGGMGGGFDGPPNMGRMMQNLNSAGIFIDKIYWTKLQLSVK